MSMYNSSHQRYHRAKYTFIDYAILTERIGLLNTSNNISTVETSYCSQCNIPSSPTAIV